MTWLAMGSEGMDAFAKTSGRLWITAVLTVALWLAPASGAAASPPSVSAYDSLTTIRSDQPLPAGGSASAGISAAGNEFESFQLAIQAGSTPLSSVRVDPGQTLTGPGGATIPASNLTIYREVDYRVTQRSDAEGATGDWPDALIPERDPIFNEDRNAFPVDLAANGRLTAWIDVLVPNHAPAGDYSGSVLVRDSGGTVAEVPVRLTVFDFSIPSTSTLRSAFGGSGGSGIDQTLFEVSGLNNRITLSNISPGRFSSFQPLLEGTDPRTRLAGAEMTAIDTYGCGTTCVGQWRSLAQQHSEVADRFFDYVCDEPHTASDWSNCDSKAAAAEGAWPGVRKLVTAGVGRAPAWASDLSPNADAFPRDGQAAYDSWRGAGSTRTLWPYTSCDSFSCGEYEGSEYDGWPGYVIDEPSSQQRAMGWLTFTSGARGELYWSTTNKLGTAWSDQYCCGGNGDGTLFYPGTTAAIGGTHAIPIESIRLKRIRDGREDYEYLHLLQRDGRGDDATAVARNLFPSMKQATASPAAVAAARGELADMIDSSPGPRNVLAVSVSGAGTVTGPGIDCPGDCTATFSEGIPVSLTATPNADATLGGWNGACAGAGHCQLTVDGDKVVGASFSTKISTPVGIPKTSSGGVPKTLILRGPSGRTHDRTPTFRLASSVPGSSFQCRAGRARWHRCSSRARLRLRYGRHKVRFRALGPNGGSVAAPATRVLRVLR